MLEDPTVTAGTRVTHLYYRVKPRDSQAGEIADKVS
jgi:hypothetical protein